MVLGELSKAGITYQYSVLKVGSGLKKAILLLNLFFCPIAFAGQQITGNLSVSGNVGIGTINNSNTNASLIINTGNVGIDSLSPGQVLDVNGTTRSTNFTITSVSGTQCLHSISGVISGSGSDCGAGGGGTAAGGLNAVQYNNPIGTFAGKENVFSFNGTNVGIGTTNGQQLFDVEGAAFILGNVGIGTSGQTPNQIVSVYQSKNSGTTVSVENDSAAGNATAQFQTFNGTKTFKFGIAGTGFSTSGPQVQGQGYIGSGSGLNIYSGGSSAIGLWPGGVETAIIDGNGNFGIGTITPVGGLSVMNGNVGIGTWVPAQLLDVSGTIRSTQMIDTGVTASKVVVTDTNHQLTAATNLTDTAYSTAVGANPTASVSTSATNGSSANFMRADAAPALSQSITPTWTGTHIFNGSPAITTGSGDNIGIGSASPGQLLDVFGSARILNSGTLKISALTASRPALIDSSSQIGTGTYSGNTTTFGTTSGTLTNGDCVKIDASGNLVDAGAACGSGSGSNFWINDTGNVGINTTYNVGIGTISQVNTLNVMGNIGIGTTAGDKYLTTVAPIGGMIIYGNVGIGTVTPGQSLDVNGAGRFLGTGNTLLNPTSGNVGIGSASPQALLDLGTTGTIVVHTTTGIGWSVKTGANTACNTTCGGSACVFGFDTGLGGSDVVNCASALADTCVCAGS